MIKTIEKINCDSVFFIDLIKSRLAETPMAENITNIKIEIINSIICLAKVNSNEVSIVKSNTTKRHFIYLIIGDRKFPLFRSIKRGNCLYSIHYKLWITLSGDALLSVLYKIDKRRNTNGAYEFVIQYLRISSVFNDTINRFYVKMDGVVGTYLMDHEVANKKISLYPKLSSTDMIYEQYMYENNKTKLCLMALKGPNQHTTLIENPTTDEITANMVFCKLNDYAYTKVNPTVLEEIKEVAVWL